MRNDFNEKNKKFICTNCSNNSNTITVRPNDNTGTQEKRIFEQSESRLNEFDQIPKKPKRKTKYNHVYRAQNEAAEEYMQKEPSKKLKNVQEEEEAKFKRITDTKVLEEINEESRNNNQLN